MSLKDTLLKLYRERRQDVRKLYQRTTSFGDYFTDRWERARFEGFGEGTSVYDNVLIIGDVRVGRDCWIGPNVVLDGSGGLEIGDHCSISAGAQIYSHHTVEWARTRGEAEIERKPTKIGSGVYIGPNAVVQMGVSIGDGAVVGALTLVRRDLDAGERFYGSHRKDSAGES